MKQTISERIRQRRRQILLHSYIYYNLNESIVSDSDWSKWAMELVNLQKAFPEESLRTQYYNEFVDFDGSTGAFLKIPEDIKTLAEYMLRVADKKPAVEKQATKKVDKPSVPKKKNARRLF